MKEQTISLGFALNPYDAYFKEGKSYFGNLIYLTFAGIIWECVTDNYIPFTLTLENKAEPYIRLGWESFDILKVFKDIDEESHDIELSLSESTRLLNFLVYEYKGQLEQLVGKRKAYKFKFYNRGINKRAFKHINERIKNKDFISEADVLALIEMNITPLND